MIDGRTDLIGVNDVHINGRVDREVKPEENALLIHASGKIRPVRAGE